MQTKNASKTASKTTSGQSLRGAARALVTSVVVAGAAGAAGPAHAAWIDTWSASPQPVWADGALPLTTQIPATLCDSTVRQVVRVSLGGARIRVALSNEYGKTPLEIDGLHVARLAGTSSDIDPSTDRAVTFGGGVTTVVPPGARILSDAIDLPVAALERFAVSLYVRRCTSLTTFHWDGRQHAELVPGNHLESARIAAPSQLDARLFLTEVLVDAPAATRTVVAFGDSITDGRGATIDTDRRWTDYLAKRLAGNDIAVLNAGISGARLLRDGMGVNGLARFDRDVLARPNVKAVVMLLGVNDIGWAGSSFAPHDAPTTARAVIDGYRQLIERAHVRGVRVIGGTIVPFEGALDGSPIQGYYSADKDKVRREVNAWIRASGQFDAVADFDAALRDPQHPARLLAAFDSGDHLHPNDAGDEMMASVLTAAMLFGTGTTAHR